MPEVTFENLVLLLSYTIGYLLVNSMNNLLLIIEKKGTKPRWTINPRKEYLNAKKAKILAIIQFLIPFVLAIYLNDFILTILKLTINYLYPIIGLTVASFYASIIHDLPYNMTRPEKIFIISLSIISAVLIFGIHQYQWFIELEPTK